MVYVALYLAIARREFFFGGGYSVSYPGAVRIYAISDRAANSLGRMDDNVESARDMGLTVRRLDDSIYQSSAKWYAGLWRCFYPLERLEVSLRGGSVMPIRYAGGAISAQAAADPAQLPFVGSIYQEWCIRDGRLYRFMGAEYGGRSASHEMIKRTDIYLFEWNLAMPFEAVPRPAERVRRVDSSPGMTLPQRWLVDAEHYLGWDSRRGRVSLLQFAGETQPAQPVRTLEGVAPVRCNELGSISVSRSGRFFAAEKKGLFVFDAKTLGVVRQIKESAALSQFFSARTDELSNTNSSCFLTDDGKLLVRIISIYKQAGERFINGTAAAVYDIDADSTREIALNLGGRTDVKDVERVYGALQFYLYSTVDGKKWVHQITDEALRQVVAIAPPATNTGLEKLTWEPASGLLVDLPGHAANAQPLDLDSEILVQNYRAAKLESGTIRYRNSSGFPKLFRDGMIKLNPF